MSSHKKKQNSDPILTNDDLADVSNEQENSDASNQSDESITQKPEEKSASEIKFVSLTPLNSTFTEENVEPNQKIDDADSTRSVSIDKQAEERIESVLAPNSKAKYESSERLNKPTQASLKRNDKRSKDSSVQKLGIIGGKGVGKSYLFQSMVYRTFATQKAGALSYYLDSKDIRLYSAMNAKDQAIEMNLNKFITNYCNWNRLATTTMDAQRWYQLQLPYRRGILGRGSARIEVEFFDGSGEGLFELEHLQEEERIIWEDGYLNAKVIVFCLPLWAAFPIDNLSDEDCWHRDMILSGFEQVIMNYRQMRERHRRTHSVRIILALTMADDPRCALTGVRDHWIRPYMDTPEHFLPQLQSGGGIALYLANARKLSTALHDEFNHCKDPKIGNIPNRLNFNGGKPWLIPLSAIEGMQLESHEINYPLPEMRKRLDPPVPVHVELPLLVALCERENALM